MMDKCRTRVPVRRLRQFSELLVALLAFLFAIPDVAAQQVNTCAEDLETAETSYVEGRFDDAIQEVTACLNRGNLTTSEAIDAYRMLALALIRKDELPQARAAIVQLLDVYPGYEADPITDPPSYTALVDIVKQQVAPATAEASESAPPPSWFRQNLKWIVPGGAVFVGGFLVAVLAAGGGGGGSNALPPPPGAPN